MANTILTHQMIAREAAVMLKESVPFLTNINRARESDFLTPINSIKKGTSVTIRVPADNVVYSGSIFAGGGSAPAQTELPVTLTINTQLHVPLTFTSIEKVLKIEDYRDRFIKPAINTLGASVHANLLSQAIPLVPNLVGTAGSLPTAFKTWGYARSRLGDVLAPSSDRYALISHDSNNELTDTTKTLFTPTKDIGEQYLEGSLGRLQGLDFFETSALPSITNGSTVSGVTVSGASQTGSNLLVGGVSSGNTWNAGQVFTIAGVYAVHPLTQTTLPWLRQFVVTANTTASTTTVTLPIYPSIVVGGSTNPGATVSASPANSAALTFVGSASTAYRQNLTYQKDAFTAAFIPLPVLASCEGYTYNDDGFAVRVMTFGDGKNDLENTRVDVLFGFAGVRPMHACRVTE